MIRTKKPGETGGFSLVLSSTTPYQVIFSFRFCVALLFCVSVLLLLKISALLTLFAAFICCCQATINYFFFCKTAKFSCFDDFEWWNFLWVSFVRWKRARSTCWHFYNSKAINNKISLMLRNRIRWLAPKAPALEHLVLLLLTRRNFRFSIDFIDFFFLLFAARLILVLRCHWFGLLDPPITAKCFSVCWCWVQLVELRIKCFIGTTVRKKKSHFCASF